MPLGRTNKPNSRNAWLLHLGRPWLLALITLLLILGAEQTIEYYQQRSTLESQRASVTGHLATVRARLDGVINSNLLMVHGLTAVIAAHPNMDQAGFAQIARGLVGKNTALRNIAAAPDLVVSMIYPLAGNEAALGLDYRSHPTQGPAALYAMKTGQAVLAGPLPLVQGGVGVIVRVPVFLPAPEAGRPGRFWGLVSSVMDADTLYHLSGLNGDNPHLQLAIRSIGGGNPGPVFFGDAGIFEREPVLSEVALPGGGWQLAAIPASGWISNNPYLWHTRLAGLLLAMAAVLAVYLIARSRLILSQTNSRLNTLLNTIPDLVWLKDKQGAYLACNPRFEQFIGRREQELLGKTDYDFFPPDVADFFRANDQAALTAGRPRINEEWLIFAADGHQELAETIKTPLRDGRGEVIGVLGIARDITERKQTEQRIQRLNRLYAVLSGINEAIIRHRDPETLYEVACRIAIEKGGFCMAWLGLVDAGGTTIRPRAHAGDSGDYLDQLHISLAEDEHGLGPTGEALRQGHHAVCNDIEHDPRMAPWREAALALGFRASAAFPLLVRGEVRGAFNLYADTPDVFDDEELRLLDELAGDIGFALEFAESDARRHQTELELRQQKELLERTGRLAQVGGWQFDVETMQGSWTAETARIQEIPEDALDASVADGLRFFQGSQRAIIEKALRAAIEQAEPYDLELEMITARGNRKWIRTRAQPIVRDGKVVRLEGAIQDITKSRQAEAMAEQRKLMLDSVFQVIPDLFFLMDADGTILDYRAHEKASLYAKPEDFLGKRMQDVMPADISRLFMDSLQRLQQDNTLVTYEYDMRMPDGEHRYEARINTLADARQYIAIVRDISAQHAARQALIDSEARYRSLLENAPFPVVMTRLRDGILRYGNHRAELRFGLTREQGIGQPASRFYQDANERQNFLEHLQRDGSVYDQEIRMLDIQGENFWALVSASIVEFEQEPAIFAAINDITRQKQAEDDIRRLVHYDVLTGLPNRSLLNDRIDYAVHLAERHKQSMALLFIDLDRFKNVNDSLGHHVGDLLLVEVARRLKLLVRKEDTVSRLGGDEFILLLANTHAEGAAHVASKVIYSLSRPFMINNHELGITPSIGIAIYPNDGANAQNLLQNADSAMYRAKRNGHNTYCFFTTEMHSQAVRTLQLENALRRALEREELLLHYQPQVDILSQDIVGCEALLRWNHPEYGMVSPAEFIPIAEDSGQILAIGEWVLRTAIKQNRDWQQAGLKPIVMAVNISAAQFNQLGLTVLVQRILQEHQLSPEHLELELTESITMEDPLVAIDIMDRLHKQGIKLSIDDFGTGYSSLSYLKRFKIHKLKIDQSFIRHVMQNPEDEAIASAVISLARSLELRTIAEGVETEQQLAFLHNKGCDEIQGYYISKPLPADEFETLLRAHSPIVRGSDL